MGDDDWDAGFARSIGLFLNGEAIAGRDRRGQRITDDSYLLLFNAHHEPIDWALPKQWGDTWEPVLNTADDDQDPDPAPSGETFPVGARSLVVLRRGDTPA